MMGKKKKKSKKLAKWQIFSLGVFVGLGFYWIPLDQEFTEVSKEKPRWAATEPIVFPMPTTAAIINHEGYTLAYDGRTRNAYWVYRKLTPAIFQKEVTRADCEFKEDPLIPKHIRATKSDYVGSGFDRGHLGAAADSARSEEAMKDSFFLSNIAPQDPQLNRGYWKKIENHMRALVKEHEEVHVFTGPLYLQTKGRDGKRHVTYQVIGKGSIAVPTHFFTCTFIETIPGKVVTSAYIVPNHKIEAKTSLKRFSVSLEELEKASGIIFAHPLS
nr:Nuclease [Chlamydiota bacterium]